jgi:hemolysin activation/secretion protein
MSKKPAHPRIVGVFLLVTSAAAFAQTTPDAGSLLQQIERDRPVAPKRLIAPDTAPAPQEMKAAPGPAVTITVTRFVFAGNTLLAEDQLAAVTARFLDRPLSFLELQKAAAAVAESYRQAGWVVRAYLPKQEIDRGSVIIQIIEGRFGRIHLDGSEPTHLKLSTALSAIEAHQKPGAPINADAIDRAVILLDDLPGIAAASTFREGQQEGETDLILKLADTPVFLGNLDIDNTGSRATGRERVAVTAYLDSPAGFGDQDIANFVHTEGSDYARLGLTVPVGVDGLRVGFNGSRLNYRVITPDGKLLDMRGIADTAGIEASYPIIRSRAANLSLAATVDRKAFDNWTNSGSTNRYRMDVATVTLAGNSFDGFGGNGANHASLTITEGRVDLTGSANQAADAASSQTDGRYQKLKLTLGRNQTVTDNISVYGQYLYQVANKNIDSSEKLTLGGSSGVRAYPSGEGSGADGHLLTLETRVRLPEGVNLTLFYDAGRIAAVNHINTAPTGNVLTLLNAYSLSGYGLSLSWVAPMGVQLKGTWARRQGENPNPTASGLDQDGSKLLNRFWFSTSVSF